MKIFNSYTNRKEDFKPINENELRMYVCGPTVYDYIHIGNARPVIFFDVVRRFFEYLGYSVKYVSNFTDIDDKIINKAIKEKVKESDISKKYIDAFIEDIESLNVKSCHSNPKVTDYMMDIINFIQELINKNYAYEVDGDVYMRVSEIPEYGKLSNRKLDESLIGTRIGIDNKKESPFDFNLWKKTSEGIQFDSPFGKGRPGWHTECVTMIDDIFGDMIDIHGGGVGLMFPHHENEIAQSIAINNHTIANYWMHNGLIQIDGKKMSKSEGETIFVKDLDADPNVFRLFLLTTHYRSPINYTDEALASYVEVWSKITRLYKQAHRKLDMDGYLNSVGSIDDKELNMIYNEFIDAMKNDFNTSNAIACIHKLVKKTNQMLRENTMMDSLNAAIGMFDDFFNILGLEYKVKPLNSVDRILYEKWNIARNEKDYEVADKLRGILQLKNII